MDGLMIYDSIIPIDLVVVIVVTNWETSNMIGQLCSTEPNSNVVSWLIDWYSLTGTPNGIMMTGNGSMMLVLNGSMMLYSDWYYTLTGTPNGSMMPA